MEDLWEVILPKQFQKHLVSQPFFSSKCAKGNSLLFAFFYTDHFVNGPEISALAWDLCARAEYCSGSNKLLAIARDTDCFCLALPLTFWRQPRDYILISDNNSWIWRTFFDSPEILARAVRYFSGNNWKLPIVICHSIYTKATLHDCVFLLLFFCRCFW